MIIKTRNIKVKLSLTDIEYIIIVFTELLRNTGTVKEYDHRIVELKHLFEYIFADQNRDEEIPF